MHDHWNIHHLSPDRGLRRLRDRTYVRLLVGTAASLVLFAAIFFRPNSSRFSSVVLAQQIELACPASSSPLQAIRNPATGGIKQWLCVDSTGNLDLTVTGGKISINFYSHNNILWVGTNASVYPFSNPQSVISNCLSLSTQLGCRIDAVSGNSFTTSSQTDIGSSNVTVVFESQPDVQWKCTDANGGSDACWNLHNGSTLFGSNNGAQGGSRTGGFYLKYDCTAKTAYGINTPEGQAGNGQAYAMAKNFVMEGCASGTVAGGGSPSVAMVNIEGISEVNEWSNALIFNGANTILTRVASNNNSSASQVGPITFLNWWDDCDGNTGCRPMVIVGPNPGQGVLPIYDIGGVCNHPGPGLACYQVNGNGARGAIFGGQISKYFEQLNAGNNSIMMQFIDSNNFLFGPSAMGVQVGDIGVDISQTAAGGTCSMHVINLRVSNSTINGIVNHISTLTISGKNYYPFYQYGGDTSCSVAPFTIDSNELDIFNRTANLIYQFPVAGNPVMRNFLDQAQQLTIDSGNTAAQDAGLFLGDRGTKIWSYKKSGNVARIQDEVNTHVHFAAVQNGETDLNAFGSSGMQFNVNNNSVGPFRFYSGGATSIEITRIDSTGNFFFHCATTTFQNCGELTGSFTGAASARVFTFPDASGTVPLLGTGGTAGLSAGTVTLAAGTASHTFTTAYTATPNCSLGPSVTGNSYKIVPSTTAITITSSLGTDTSTVGWTCQPTSN